MRTLRTKHRWIVGLLLLSCIPCFSNTDSRRWTLASDESFDAELVRYDVVNDVAVLRIDEEQEKTYSLEDFSPIDAAWLLEWATVTRELDALQLEMKGTFSHYQHQGEYIADYYVYTPSKYAETNNLPMLFLFHPGGKAARYVKRFMMAADALDLIVVSSDSFRNTGAVWNERDDAMLACFKELLPSLEETVAHDPKQLYLGGSSGGAQSAYHYSTKVDRSWAGIFSNGGWIGGPKYYDLPFPQMRVVMVNGHRDPANRWIKRDAAVLEQRGCAVNVYAFEGGHQVPPPAIQFEALEWLINGDAEKMTAQQAESTVPSKAAPSASFDVR